jgi:hypothetical protein
LLTFDYVKLAAVETPEVKLITRVPADAMTSGKLPGPVGRKPTAFSSGGQRPATAAEIDG